MRFAVIAVFLLLWHGISSFGGFSPILLPSPSKVFVAGVELATSEGLLTDVMHSLMRVCAGFAISAALATPLGIYVGLSPRAKRALGPLLNLLRPIPPIAWIPLAILWFGIGSGPACFLTTIASFFPILLNSCAGVEEVNPRHLEVARCFGASRLTLLREVVLPAALPTMITGYRVGFGVGWMAIIAAELVASRSGLGYLIHVSQDMLRTDRAMAGMAVIGLLGLAFDVFFIQMKRLWTPWSLA